MRVLHLVKTSDGGGWAAWQAARLVERGVEVHVALPDRRGRYAGDWKTSGAVIHELATDFPVRTPWKLLGRCRDLRRLVAEVSPDLIHSHFVGPTLVMRYALGAAHPVPRVFQVPGPLHLEHGIYRKWEVGSAGPQDSWVGSSRCIIDRYRDSGIEPARLFLSYYGIQPDAFATERTGLLRQRLGVRDDQLMVGSISWMYPPKYYLGQSIGLKCHEDMIDALAEVVRVRGDVVGVFAGGGWGGSDWYESKLRRRAAAKGGDRIQVPGALPASDARLGWADFDCVPHVPMSENCGGAVEPLLVGVPTIASRTGGLTEVVFDGVTGVLVPPRDPGALAEAILGVLGDIEAHRVMAARGGRLVRAMFDVRRTADEVFEIYRYILGERRDKPPEYDSRLEATLLS